MNKLDLSKKTVIESLPIPASVVAFHWDANQKHLGLSISPKGRRSWVLERRVEGRNVRRTLGTYPGMTYRAALAEFTVVNGELEQGRDHVAEKKAAKASVEAAAASQVPTLADAIARYVADRQRSKDGKKLKERTRDDYLKMVAAPRPFKSGKGMTKAGELFMLADRRLDEITADDLRAVHAAARGARRQTYAMQVLRAVLNWFGVTVPDNPLGKTVAGMKRIVLTPSAGDPNPIPPERVHAWWQQSFAVRSQDAADLLRLMLLTGMRGIEVKAATVRDADLGARRLKLVDTKNRSTHVVLLSDAAFTIVEKHAKGKKPGERLFAIDDAGKTMASINKLAGMEPSAHTPHDLRATFASIAEELVSAYTLKRLVNHSMAGDVTGGHYIGKSESALRAGWQAVADFVQT